jgi:DNA-binding MarR family transcriptional regulator
MTQRIRDEQYHSLAELRYRIRLFLQASELSAKEVGVEPQQYQMLLAIRAMNGTTNGTKGCTIRALAERLLLKHHSTVELVDRLEARKLVSRSRDRKDRRHVFVALQPSGRRLLEKVVRRRLTDLRGDGRDFVRALDTLLNGSRHTSSAK